MTKAISSERLALLVFLVALPIALVVYLGVGRHNWFFLDEWDFLATRHIGSFGDLMRPHNEHWSTLPIIVYRIWFRLFGLRTYVPYVLSTIVLHLTAAILLRVLMRRAGVHPWLATAAAGLFLFLGSGYQNIVWGFQIGFVGSLVGGLAQMVLADHDGGIDRRDVLAVLCGLAGLMCSGVSVPLVGAVGLAVLLRRGWRPALVQTVPLGVVYAVWYAAYGHEGVQAQRPGPRQLLDFVQRAFAHAATSIGDIGVVTVALVLVLVVGAVLWVLDRRGATAPVSWAPWSLVAAAVAFTFITGSGRVVALGVSSAEASRYVYLLAAMLLPAVAVAAQAIATRWRPALPILAVLFLLPIPGNVQEVLHRDTIGEHLLAGNPGFVKALPSVQVAQQVPRSVQPDRLGMGGVTIGWLRAARASGRLARPQTIAPLDAAAARTRLSVEQMTNPHPTRGCRPLRKPVRKTLTRGEHLRFRGRLDVRLVKHGRAGPPATYRAALGSMLVIRVDRATLELARTPPTTRTQLC